MVANGDVADGADLAGDRDVIAEAGAAGNAGECNDQAMFADHDSCGRSGPDCRFWCPRR